MAPTASPDQRVWGRMPIAGAPSTAWQISAQLAKRRLLKANARKAFHQGSIRCKEAI
jgi:hypothetical protein